MIQSNVFLLDQVVYLKTSSRVFYVKTPGREFQNICLDVYISKQLAGQFTVIFENRSWNYLALYLMVLIFSFCWKSIRVFDTFYSMYRNWKQKEDVLSVLICIFHLLGALSSTLRIWQQEHSYAKLGLHYQLLAIILLWYHILQFLENLNDFIAYIDSPIYIKI